MAVSFNRVGGNLTVTITVDVSDLIVLASATKADKIMTAMQRVQDQLSQLMQASQPTGIDAQIAELQAKKAALPPPVVNF